MCFYVWLSRRIARAGCDGKMVWSATVAVFLPLVLTTGLWASFGETASPSVLLVAAGLAGGLAATSLVAFLRPLIDLTRLATRQLDDYLVERVLPGAPSVPLDDEMGKLLQEVREVCYRLEGERCSLESDAALDHLSGVLNRRGGETRLRELVADAGALDAPWSVAVVDADHFKELNDRCGHAVGDRALQTIAADLAALELPGAVVTRWGGDEFVLAAPGGADEMARVMQTFVDQVAARSIASREGPVTVTASVGVASGLHNEEIEDALERADAALYRAKGHGGNEVAGTVVAGSAVAREFVASQASR